MPSHHTAARLQLGHPPLLLLHAVSATWCLCHMISLPHVLCPLLSVLLLLRCDCCNCCFVTAQMTVPPRHAHTNSCALAAPPPPPPPPPQPPPSGPAETDALNSITTSAVAAVSKAAATAPGGLSMKDGSSGTVPQPAPPRTKPRQRIQRAYPPPPPPRPPRRLSINRLVSAALLVTYQCCWRTRHLPVLSL